MKFYIFYNRETGVIQVAEYRHERRLSDYLRLNPQLDYVEHAPIKISSYHVMDVTTTPPTLIDNTPAITDEMKWDTARGIRLTLLNKTDWTQMPDSPLSESKRAEWAVYRQALRDITNQSDPDNITWPTAP